MRRYADSVLITGAQGLIQPAVAASVTVLGHVSQTPATIYSDDGITVTGNPVVTDINGRFAFYVADGRYDLRITGNNITTYTVVDQEIIDVTEANAGDANFVIGTHVTGSTNPATAGVIRLASTDTIDWRNNANNADIALSKNSSDVLLYNGNPLTGLITVNAQTANYNVVSGDFSGSKLISMNSASATTVTLLASAPTAGQSIQVQNTGTATVTIARNGLNIDGAAANVLLTGNSGILIASDGANYFTNRGGANAISSTPMQAQLIAPPNGLSTFTPLTISSPGSFGGTNLFAIQDFLGNFYFLSGNSGPSSAGLTTVANNLTLSNILAHGAVVQINEGGTPAGVASNGLFWADSTTHTLSHNPNNNGTMSFSGAWVNTNLTPVTVNANVATDQSLMTVSVPAGTLNRVGRSLRFYGSGVYSTPAASTSVVTVKVKYGALTLITWTSTALATVQATNNQINISGMLSVQTGGASGVFEPHGVLTIDLGAGNLVADTSFADVNTATVGTIDVTAAQNLLVTIAFSNASASNTATQRQMVLETVG
jgi:hypothetical protein